MREHKYVNISFNRLAPRKKREIGYYITKFEESIFVKWRWAYEIKNINIKGTVQESCSLIEQDSKGNRKTQCHEVDGEIPLTLEEKGNFLTRIPFYRGRGREVGQACIFLVNSCCIICQRVTTTVTTAMKLKKSPMPLIFGYSSSLSSGQATKTFKKRLNIFNA